MNELNVRQPKLMSSSSCSARTRPDQHVRMTYKLEAGSREMRFVALLSKPWKYLKLFSDHGLAKQRYTDIASCLSNTNIYIIFFLLFKQKKNHVVTIQLHFTFHHQTHPCCTFIWLTWKHASHLTIVLKKHRCQRTMLATVCNCNSFFK